MIGAKSLKNYIRFVYNDLHAIRPARPIEDLSNPGGWLTPGTSFLDAQEGPLVENCS
jgi:hypothetical protein